jgi:pimeloyl-ACP methyl ester carboxylesterase
VVAARTSPALAGHRLERYRTAERALWDRYGLKPTERFCEVGPRHTRLRIQEVGAGQAALFVHGAGPPGAGSVWAPLVAELGGIRCLVPDLPGDGLSAPLAETGRDRPRRMADLLADALDAVEVDRVDLVGWSFGAAWTLRLAQRHPARVGRIVLLAFSPVWSDVRPPAGVRLDATPIGAVTSRLPASPRVVKAMLRHMVGHGASLDAGRIPDELIEWIVALLRDTDTARNDRAWLPSLLGWRGAKPGLAFDDEEVAAIRKPVLYVHGTADWRGTAQVAARTTALLPGSRTLAIDDGGHIPWLDDPVGIGRAVAAFLAG